MSDDTDRRDAPDVMARLFEAGYLIGEERAAIVAVYVVPGRNPVVVMHGAGVDLASCIKALKSHLQGKRADSGIMSEVSEVEQ